MPGTEVCEKMRVTLYFFSHEPQAESTVFLLVVPLMMTLIWGTDL